MFTVVEIAVPAGSAWVVLSQAGIWWGQYPELPMALQRAARLQALLVSVVHVRTDQILRSR